MDTIISINHRQTENIFSSDVTILDVVENILKRSDYKNLVISHIDINGKKLDTRQENEIFPKHLYEFESINFNMKPGINLAFEALDSCDSYIDTIIEQINQLIISYQDDQTQKSNQLFVDVIEVTDLFVNLISRIQHTIHAHLEQKWEKPLHIQELETSLLSILQAVIPAKENNDLAMLCELLGDKLTENLSKWKNKALPNLRALRLSCESRTQNN